MQKPILIVGQGLAGTWLSFFFRKANIDFRIIDNNHFQSSSAVAAGLINPIVPKRLTKTWMFDELFPDFISSTYCELETRLGNQYFYPNRKIHKLFFHADDITAWENGRNARLQNVLADVKKSSLNTSLEPHLGYAAINYSAWVNTPNLISDYRIKLTADDLLLSEKFDHTAVEISDNLVLYKGAAYERIIFCEGVQNSLNPWFASLPMLPAKGEELTLHAPGLNLTATVTAGLHIIPLGNDLYSVGSTFRWDDLRPIPTEAAKEEILTKFSKIYKGAFQIVNHIAGIRPAARDRRPFVGFHPAHKRIGILNGLGTKGLILAPLMSHYLTQNILHGTEIPKECSIQRFYK